MSDDEYQIPLQDQRVFGAGIKRKRVKFVPSSSFSTSTSLQTSKASAQSVSDLYLSIVLPRDQTARVESSKSGSPEPQSLPDKSQPREELSESELCEICKLPPDSTPASLRTEDDTIPSATDIPNDRPPPKPRPHEASLAHQVCLTHSYPPSHLDRNRKGLAYLSAYGWDPDSRLGLGVSGQGIQFPIKTKPKDDKMGIGVVLPKEANRRKKEKVEKLDAGKIRKLHEKDKKKGEKLREIFYRNDDVERYLGGG
jgi:hypothetical protein